MLTSHEIVSQRFSGTGYRPGYRREDVDAFLDRAAATLRASESGGAAPNPVTQAEAAGMSFPWTSVSPAYDPAEVDAFMASVVAALAAAWRADPGVHPRHVGAPRAPATRPGLLRIVQEFIVGTPPDQRPARVARAPRAPGRYVWVDPAGVHWRTWTGRSGVIAAADVGSVEILNIEYPGKPASIVRPYGLVLDRSGSALLRVGMGCWGRRWRTRARFRGFLRELCAPFGVPVTWWTNGLGRPKDARRRWPEAFSFIDAYPYFTGFAVVVAYCVIAQLIDRLLAGQ